MKDTKIGLATVYRSLKVFVKLDFVKQMPRNDVNYCELKIFSKKPLHSTLNVPNVML